MKTLKSTNPTIEIEDIYNLKDIGNSTMDKIIEIISTGTCNLYEKVHSITDPRKDFIKIHGIGNVKANELISDGFTSINELQNCKNIQDYLNDTQLLGLKYYEDFLLRIPRLEISKHEVFLKRILAKIDLNAELTIAGSYRRGAYDSGDIDVLLKANDKSNIKNG